MRILVTGVAGQVGGAAVAALRMSPGCEILPVDRSSLDISDVDALRRHLDSVRPDMVVNCAAYTAVDSAESEAERAFAVNGRAPGGIAEWCGKNGAPMVHFSTDYVFDGRKGRPYSPDDECLPINVYGASKLAGEQAVRARCPRHIIVRTSWIYARSGRNFVRTILRLGMERPELRVVDDQQGCPTSASDLADLVLHLVDCHRRGEMLPWGTCHYAGDGAATWYELAETVWQVAAGLVGRRPRIQPVPTDSYPTAARRPPNSVLACEGSFAQLGLRPRPWRNAVEATVHEIVRGERE